MAEREKNKQKNNLAPSCKDEVMRGFSDAVQCCSASWKALLILI